MPDLDWPIPEVPDAELGPHLFALATVKWVFDVDAHKVEDFHDWLTENEAPLATELAASGRGVGYFGTFGVVDPASGYDAVRRYRTFDSKDALKAQDPDGDQSGAPYMRRANELAHFWMADAGSWEEIYIPAVFGPAYKFAGD